MSKCEECGVELDFELGPDETATCWDCAVRDFPELAPLEATITAGFRNLTEGMIHADGRWQLKQ